jgi:hypothetical protein
VSGQRLHKQLYAGRCSHTSTRIVQWAGRMPDCMGCIAQVKHKGARRISFEQFVTALAAIADTKQVREDTAPAAAALPPLSATRMGMQTQMRSKLRHPAHQIHV